MVQPSFAMFWDHEVPTYRHPSGKAAATVWCGSNNYFGIESNNNAPPPNSWASDVNNDVAIMHIVLQPGGSLTIPAAHEGEDVNRSLFYVEGAADEKMKVDGQPIDRKVIVQVKSDVDIDLKYDETAQENGEFLLLQGRPMQEPVKQYGPFVMNTDEESDRAFRHYQLTKFGGWPWPRADMVFPRDKGRFAKLNDEEFQPTDATCLAD